MKKIITKGAVIFLITLLFISCGDNRDELKNSMTVVFYNVENLFDIFDDPEKPDEEFTPGSEKNWNEERYSKKINDISKVLNSINKDELPELIGLCEVENRTVLEDLIKSENLKKGNYKIVHYESPDFRGIDNALLYRQDEFTVTYSRPISLKFESDPDYITRDILYVKGKTVFDDVFHLFVNHWPSRTAGLEETEAKRIRAASVLKNVIDSILNVEADAQIIIMGDMNDEPDNLSLNRILEAKDPLLEPDAPLQNLMFAIDKQQLGSYNFRGNWNMLDNMVVSKNLLDNTGFRCENKQGFVFHEDWMEFTNDQGIMSPNRTYGGPNYYGGISDHFPVFIKLVR